MEPIEHKDVGVKRISLGKYNGLNAIANEWGIVAAAAMDQRRTLCKAITQAKGSDATATELSEFKTLVTEELTHHASAILLDPEYGLEAVEAVKQRDKKPGVLLAYEQTGYDAEKGRVPELLSQWSVRRLVLAGANAIKLLLYYDPDDTDQQLNTTKQVRVERVGAECRGCDIPFFLEVVTYSNMIDDEEIFARAKPEKVRKYMEEFSKPQYGVDVLKVEAPVDVRYVAGLKANSKGQIVYSREKALEYFREAATASLVPFIYLSAGVTHDVFLETLELAAEAKTAFSGVLCGRATWQDGIKEYAQGGAAALRRWLKGQGKDNIQALNETLGKGAEPWWNRYGGKENIEIVDTKASE
jgi:tagatose 1,6-diphosphate aldolase